MSDDPFSEELYYDPAYEPYDVECARCGKVLPCTEAVVEEGAEWECVACWERLNALEKAKCPK